MGSDSRLIEEFTEPLVNGAELPKHPAYTTGREVVEYGEVQDDQNGIVLQGGLHQNEIAMLMSGEQGALSHLFRYAIRDRKIFHTRRLVTISVKTREVEEVV